MRLLVGQSLQSVAAFLQAVWDELEATEEDACCLVTVLPREWRCRVGGFIEPPLVDMENRLRFPTRFHVIRFSPTSLALVLRCSGHLFSWGTGLGYPSSAILDD